MNIGDLSTESGHSVVGAKVSALIERPQIFNYLNYREFLQSYYLYKKQTQPRYSYAVFSLKAGIKSPNYLKLVMEGVRNVTNENVLRFAKALSLSEIETVYWENLVAFNQAKTPEQRRHYLLKLTHSPLPEGQRDSSAIREIRDEWDYCSVWHHAAIRELVLLPEFKEDAAAIAVQLKNRITVEQVKESLQLLMRMKFLVRDESGRLKQAEREIRYAPMDDFRNFAVQKFHTSTTKLALDSIENDPVGQRDFSGLMIAVTKDSIPVLKSKISEFRKELNREFSKLQSADAVVHINFQMIPVTELSRKEEKK